MTVPFVFGPGVGMVDHGQIDANFAATVGLDSSGNAVIKGTTTLGNGGTNWFVATPSASPTLSLAGAGAGDLNITTFGQRNIFLRSVNGVLAQFTDFGAGAAIANRLLITAQPAGVTPTISLANSTDTNVGLNFVPKGTGGFSFQGLLSAPQGLSIAGTKTSAVDATINFIRGLQTVNGATISGSFAPFNIIQVTENATVSSGTGQGFYVQHNVGGAGATGGRQALQADLTLYATTGDTGRQFTAVQGNFFGSVSQTGLIGYGANFTAQAKGSSSLSQLVGQENNVGIQTGSSALLMTGIQVVGFGNGVVSGTNGLDSAYVIGHQVGFAGFDYGWRMSGVGGEFPLKSTATVLGVFVSVPLGANGGTVATGIDMLTGLTITGNAFQSTNAAISGAGVVTGASYKVGANQVVGARVTGWGAASNGSRAALNGSTATLAQTSAALASLIADLTTHGLIGA